MSIIRHVMPVVPFGGIFTAISCLALSSIVGQFDCPLLSGARGVGGDHLSRFAARSLRPGEFALASVTSSIVPNVIRVYPPPCRSRRRLLSLLLFTCGAVTFRPLARNLIPASMSVVRHVMPVSSIEIEYHSIFLQKIPIYLHISFFCCNFASKIENISL